MGMSHAPIFMLTSAKAVEFHFRRGRMVCMLSECHVSFSCPWMKAIACINDDMDAKPKDLLLGHSLQAWALR